MLTENDIVIFVMDSNSLLTLKESQICVYIDNESKNNDNFVKYSSSENFSWEFDGFHRLQVNDKRL